MRKQVRYPELPEKKDMVIERLKKQGFRITKQRELLIDIILSEPWSCCKEIYALASKKDDGIGIATVYRTVDALEKVGALKRGGSYQLCNHNKKRCQCCFVELEDGSVIELDYASVERFMEAGMLKCGLSKGKKVRSIAFIQSEE
ncbi:MAG TPA: Fur family transcriptional regulator [Lachnospiraceae bacterium]|nr:Fur family transcriptional regulator [Lachnospiraceae bacterium]